MDLAGLNILVLGLSKSGVAAAKLAKKRGATVRLSEGNPLSEKNKSKFEELEALGIEFEVGSHSEEFIEGANLVITSPGIAPHSEIIKKLQVMGVEIISELEFAYRMSDVPFIIITGTNGKTTTTALTEHVLSKKMKVKACGNIGVPTCEIVDEDLDFFVCEASSFQLEMTSQLKPFISVWTNFTPDHIDWHQGLENYFNAKAKIFKNSQASEYSVLNAKDEKLMEFSSQAAGKVFYFAGKNGENCCFVEDGEIKYMSDGICESIIKISQCPLIGEHNYQNIMCAVICAKLVGVDNETIRNAIMEFRAPAHRLEKIREFNGITFYNDSKATNPEASIVAINSFNDTDVVLIAGGRDKNTDLKEFCESVNNHIKTVILIGEASDRFEENLLKSGFDNIIRERTLEDAIDKGIELSPEVVLLSPACASFDMFTSYENRGDVFREYVLSRV